MDPPGNGWESVQEPPATKAQRRALYRLSYPRALVKTVTVEEADVLSKIALAARERTLPLLLHATTSTRDAGERQLVTERVPLLSNEADSRLTQLHAHNDKD